MSAKIDGAAGRSADVDEGRRVLKIEAQSILDLAERLNGGFSKAVDMVHGCTGKVIVSGIGKSGQIARKMASTLSSTEASAPRPQVAGNTALKSDPDWQEF